MFQRNMHILGNTVETKGAQSNLDYLCQLWGTISWKKKSQKVHHQMAVFLGKSRKSMCSSGKYPYPPHGRSLEILKRWGI